MTSTTGQLISIDAESNGLAGAVFAVAMTLSTPVVEQSTAVFRCPIDGPVDPWVAQNVIPAIDDVPVDCADYQQLLHKVRETYGYWGGRQVPTIAFVAWPVDGRLLSDVFAGDNIRQGPYPLIDVSSVLAAKGHDPTSLDGYLDTHGIPHPPGVPHHPLHDARAAERCYRHAAAAARPREALTTYGELADLLQGLPTLVREARRGRRLSLRQAGEQIGCSHTTVGRVEAGDGCDMVTARAVLRWLDRSHG